MVNLANQSYVLGLFGAQNSNGIVSLDLSGLLTPLTGTAAGLASGQSSTTASSAAAAKIPSAPWNAQETTAQSNQNVQTALAGESIFGSSPPKLSTPDPTGDYTKLFTLYQGLTTLEDVATAAQNNKDPETATQLSNAFQNGLSQISTFVNGTTFKGLRLADGTNQTSAQSTLAISKPATTYTTQPLTTSMTATLPALQSNAVFNINVTLNKKTTSIPIDLSKLPQPPSLSDAVIYINQQLKAAGVQTRFALDRIPGQPQTITAAGSTVTLPAGPDQFAMQVNIGTSETVSFSAPQTANAVYVGETVGNPNPDHDPTTNDSNTNAQLVKIQTDTSTVPGAPQNGQANYVPGQAFTQNLGPNIGTIHDEQVGPDGSVYMIADVTGTVNGQDINGTQDTALLKYDAAGNLVYTRTLGASNTATGYSLAVSSTGQVAVAGSVTGPLLGATDGALNSAGSGAFDDDSDSFVTLYDNQGNEVWTDSRGSRLQDQATQVAFSADGKTVYVGGQAQGQMPGAGPAIGGYDGYIEGITTNAKTGAPQATFTQNFGTTGADAVKGMVVDGNTMITASVENGHAVLRNFDLSSGTPVQVSTRDLGDLQGGTIAGLSLNGNGQVVVAGTTTNGALNAGTVTAAANGGTDAFAAQIDENLADSPNNAIAYYGTSGNDHATALAVSGGVAYITGTTGTVLPNQSSSAVDGFVAGLDIGAGTVTYQQTLTGKDQMASPTAIAVDSSGGSILDALGLPKGTIGGDQSLQITAQSSLRAGDQFTVAVGNGPATTITIDQGETLSTLATKIQRATGFEATATVMTNLNGQQALSIKPAYAQAEIVLGAGPSGKNALSTLGLPEGVLSETTFANNQTMPADGGPKIYGLGLSSTLNFSDSSQISHAQSVIAQAEGVVRQAYNALVAAATPQNPAQQAAVNNGSANNPVPTYLTNQIANLQAGLARLTGGSSSGSSLNALI